MAAKTSADRWLRLEDVRDIAMAPWARTAARVVIISTAWRRPGMYVARFPRGALEAENIFYEEVICIRRPGCTEVWQKAAQANVRVGAVVYSRRRSILASMINGGRQPVKYLAVTTSAGDGYRAHEESFLFPLCFFRPLLGRSIF